jgi:uncharacterized membrane protein (UPF0136 family)
VLIFFSKIISFSNKVESLFFALRPMEEKGEATTLKANVLKTQWQWRVNMVLAGAMIGGGAAAYTRHKSLIPLVGGGVFGGLFAIAGFVFLEHKPFSFKYLTNHSPSNTFSSRRFNIRHGSERLGHVLGAIGGVSLAAYSARRTLVCLSPVPPLLLVSTLPR